ncbi:MAG TPA: GspH/FimT family pseudopilin [Rhodanobacteraceae bacterium]|nr:GspH/FimT family pseudopilin [Rhodanobacteraceae bacterium]
MSHARTRGFSLVELVVTVLVVAILTAVAWPNFRDFMHRNTVTAQANQVLAALQYARNEAVSRRYPSALCGSTDGVSCTAGDTSFENGWMIWRDSTLAGTPSYSSTKDELLRVNAAQTGVSIRSFGGSGTANLIAFDQRGAVIGAGGAVTNIVVCAKNSSSDLLGANTQKVPGKYVRVDASGRITVQNLATTDQCDGAPS